MLALSGARGQEAPGTNAAAGSAPAATNGAASNLISITLDDVALEDLVRMCSRIGGVTIMGNPTDLQWRVSVNATDADWKALLTSGLASNHLLLVKQPGTSGVYVIERGTNYVPYSGAVVQAWPPAAGWHEPSYRCPFPQRLMDVIAGLNRWTLLDNTLGNAHFAATLSCFLLLAVLCMVLMAIRRGVARGKAERSSGPTRRPMAAVTGGWTIAACLSFVYGFLLGPWIFLPLIWHLLKVDPTMPFPTPQMTALISAMSIAGSLMTLIILGVCVGVAHWLRLSEKPLRRRAVAALLAVWALPLVFLLRDAPPVREAVTWRDLPVPPVQMAESHACLQKLIGTNAPAIRHGSDHVWNLDEMCTNALAYSDEIERAWQAVSPGWASIEQLDTFPAIADLAELPNPCSDDWPNLPLPHLVNMRNLAQACCAYALLKSAQGHPDQGARVLATFHSVVRKALPYARYLGVKMMFVVVGDMAIRTAHEISINPACSQETRDILLGAFPPLSREETSLRISLKGDYVEARAYYEQRVPRVGLVLAMKEQYMPWDSVKGWILPTVTGWERHLSAVLTFLIFHPNRTARDSKVYFERWLAAAETNPLDLSHAPTSPETHARRPELHNFGGWWLVNVHPPTYTHAIRRTVQVKVHSDLLAMELARLNGKKLELPDYFTGQAFLTDEATGELYSPGLDKSPGTDDDIRLSKPW